MFLNKNVPDELVGEVISSAICAPSSRNSQPWQFIVVKDKVVKEKITKLKGDKDYFQSANLVIVVCVDFDKSSVRWVEDGVTATGNLLLSIHDVGLGSVYISAFNESKPEIVEELREILNIPNNLIPVTLLPVGYPDPAEVLEKKTLVDLNDVVQYR